MRVKRHHKWAVWGATLGIVATTAVAVPVVRQNTTNSNLASNVVCHVRGQLPDPICTPGVAAPAVTQANIQSTICKSGYTATVRPSVSVTSAEKIVSEHQYGYPTGSQGEYDHLISLELGGSSDTKNLWFESGPIPNPKDKVENRLHAEVCSGKITLQQAQHEISTDWTKAQ